MKTSNNGQYFEFIDGLRAIAVLSVIVNHLSYSLMPGGYLGVDIFFVISGFVITHSIIKSELQLKPFVVNFYKRRFKRLFPALLVCVIATLAIFASISELSSNQWYTGGASLVGFSNIVLYFNETSYWSEDAKLNPFTHTWSLGVEEQFYFIFPLIVWFTLLRGRNQGRQNWFLTTSFTLVLLSIFGFVYFSSFDEHIAFFLSPFRFWELFLGAITYVFSMRMRSLAALGRIIYMVINVVAIVCIAYLLFKGEQTQYLVIPVVFLTAVLLFGCGIGTFYAKPIELALNNYVVNYIGKISYSLYLWHWPTFVFFAWLGLKGEFYVIQLLATFVLACISFHFIEQTFRYKQDQKIYTAFLSIGAISLLIIVTATFLSSIASRNSTPEITSLNDVLCEKEGARTIRTVGNSHSNHFLNVLNDIGEKCGFTVVNNPYPDYVVIPSGDGRYTEEIEPVMNELNNGDLLVLSSRNRFLYEVPYMNGKGTMWIKNHINAKENGMKVNGKEIGLEHWLFELDTILEMAKNKRIKVLLVMPNVEFDRAVLPQHLCRLRKDFVNDPECNTTVNKTFLDSRFPSAFFDAVEKRDRLHGHFSVFDPLPIFCNDEMKVCTRIINGVFAYADTNHLSPLGAKLMENDFFNHMIEEEIVTVEDIK